MVRLSSAAEAIGAIIRARHVSACAYTLADGPVVRALCEASRHGARVNVRLEGAPYGAGASRVGRQNARVAAELTRAGAVVRFAHPSHVKAIAAGDDVFLDDRNWARGDIVLRYDGGAPPAVTKRDALALEAQTIGNAAPGDRAIVQTETFGSGNAVYSALSRLAKAGARPRLIVNERRLRGNARERALLVQLRRSGVDVRACRDCEKLAAAGERAWIGSANATIDPSGKTPDWGAASEDPEVVRAVRARLEERWREARAIRAD